MRKKQWKLFPGVVRVTIHPPVETAGWDVSRRAELAVKVRDIIATALPPGKRGPPARPAAEPSGETEML